MIHDLLKTKRVILASASPRRKEIFRLLGIKAIQAPSNIDENTHYTSPAKIVTVHAINKAKHTASDYDPRCIVVAADTIVYHDKTVLGKPETDEQARVFLRRLSGETHCVYTGIAISFCTKVISAYEKTNVTFEHVSEKDISSYIATGEPFDKAGAYGIQGYGGQFVKKINGCYFNVMGFPIAIFYQLLKEVLG